MMEPGRALDAWLSEQLFGYRVSQGPDLSFVDPDPSLADDAWRPWEPRRPLYECRVTGWRVVLPFYSEDITPAWLVVGAMRLKGFRFSLYDQPGTGIKLAQFFTDAEYGASVGHSTDAGAIAMAAQQALCAARPMCYGRVSQQGPRSDLGPGALCVCRPLRPPGRRAR